MMNTNTSAATHMCWIVQFHYLGLRLARIVALFEIAIKVENIGKDWTVPQKKESMKVIKVRDDG